MRKGALALLGGAALTAAAFTGTAPSAWADGAIAMGTTGNVVRDGIAFGMVVDEPKDQAAETAVQRCRSFQARAAAERCSVVATFSRQCFAVAYDPEPGTPGAGWGVGVDQLDANLKAVAMCEEAAGPARKGYCQVASAGCDSTGQGVSQTTTPQPSETDAKPAQDTPVPAPQSKQAPSPKPSAQGKDRGAGAGTTSPAVLAGVMATVGVAYTLGQLARGKVEGGFGKRQMLVGAVLGGASAAIAALLGWAGTERAIVMAIAGGIAIAAAIFA